MVNMKWDLICHFHERKYEYNIVEFLPKTFIHWKLVIINNENSSEL